MSPRVVRHLVASMWVRRVAVILLCLVVHCEVRSFRKAVPFPRTKGTGGEASFQHSLAIAQSSCALRTKTRTVPLDCSRTELYSTAHDPLAIHNRSDLCRRIASFKRTAHFRYTYRKLAPATVLRRVADGSGAMFLPRVQVVFYLYRFECVAMHSLLEFTIRQREAVVLS